VTFCNLVTEATMYALRLARATIGRPMLAKFKGGYGLNEGHFHNDIDTQPAAV
jgi:glutamate-1-semialdehyde aminotransferase